MFAQSPVRSPQSGPIEARLNVSDVRPIKLNPQSTDPSFMDSLTLSALPADPGGEGRAGVAEWRAGVAEWRAGVAEWRAGVAEWRAGQGRGGQRRARGGQGRGWDGKGGEGTRGRVGSPDRFFCSAIVNPFSGNLSYFSLVGSLKLKFGPHALCTIQPPSHTHTHTHTLCFGERDLV